VLTIYGIGLPANVVEGARLLVAAGKAGVAEAAEILNRVRRGS
jgi:hypothetical protein